MISRSRRDSVGGGVVAEFGGGGGSRNFPWSPNPSQISGGEGVVAEFFPDRDPEIRFRARKIPRECTPRHRFRKMLPKKSSFWRKINISLKLPEFREFFFTFP